MGDKRCFSYQYPFFSKDFEIFSLDLKGFGENKDMEYPYSLDDYINQVLTFMKEQGIKKPFVIAHSFGGRIALKLMAQNKDLFSKVVLTGCAGLKPRFSFFKWLKKRVFKFLKIFIKKEKLKSFYSKDYNALSPVLKQSFIKIVNEHLDGLLDKIDNEVLLIWGRKDKETPLYMAKKLKKKIKNCSLSVYNSGHFAFIDCPYTFNTEVKEFFLN